MSTGLRILAVSDVSPVHIAGGGERVLWELASRLRRRGHAVRILSRSPEGSHLERCEREGIPIRHFLADHRSALWFVATSILRARRAVSKAVREERVDVLHLYQPFAGYGALHSRRTRHVPVLYTFLSPAPLEYLSRIGMSSLHRSGLSGRAARFFLQRIERACLQRADRIHVLSDFSAAQVRDLYRIPAPRITKIPAGADTERFRPAADRQAVRATLRLPAQSPLLLTIRNLEPRMGLDTLIRSMAILRRDVPSAMLIVGGAGSLRECLESLAASLDLGRHVRFVGYVPEPVLPLYYQAADVFVLPTRELEGFGLISVEAMACGTPVLGTTAGATPEILEPLDPSLLLHEATPEGIAEDLRRFLGDRAGDRSGALALRRACREYVERHYTWDLATNSVEALLGDLVSNGAAGPSARDAQP